MKVLLRVLCHGHSLRRAEKKINRVICHPDPAAEEMSLERRFGKA